MNLIVCEARSRGQPRGWTYGKPPAAEDDEFSDDELVEEEAA